MVCRKPVLCLVGGIRSRTSASSFLKSLTLLAEVAKKPHGTSKKDIGNHLANEEGELSLKSAEVPSLEFGWKEVARMDTSEAQAVFEKGLKARLLQGLSYSGNSTMQISTVCSSVCI